MPSHQSKPRPGSIFEALSDPKRWAKNTIARTRYGKPTSNDDRYATSRCIGGWGLHIYGGDIYGFEVVPRLNAAMKDVEDGDRGIAFFNDTTDHETLLTVLKKAGV